MNLINQKLKKKIKKLIKIELYKKLKNNKLPIEDKG